MAGELGANRWSAAAVIASVVCTIGWAAHAAPAPNGGATRPTDDATLVARLPARAAPEAKALAALRARTRTSPRDLDAALALARAQIQASRVDGDPRPLGYAEQTLRPWLASTEPSPDVLVLSATVAQSRHEFEAALALLDRGLARDPQNAQAWLTRASILAVIGRYDEAQAACARLSGLAAAQVVHACSAPIRGLRGQAGEAAAELTATLDTSRTDAERAWLLSLLSELSYWTGDARTAEVDARSALERDPGDRYTRALLADLMLDESRYAEVRALLAGQLGDDALLLRDTLAAQALHAPEASAQQRRLEERTAQNRLRGDASHQREEARLLLALPGREAAALDVAEANFGVQKEAWDARLLLEAAAAAKQPERAAQALAWLSTTGFESPRLRGLAAGLRGAP